MTQNLMLRQGDVLPVVVSAIPPSAVEVPRTSRGVVLAEGTATGHAHAIPSHAAKLFRDGRVLWLRAVEPVELTHEEHKTRCSVDKVSLASHYDTSESDKLERDRYYSAAHAPAGAIALLIPGATRIPAGDYRVTNPAEYVPGELPRPVVD